MTQLQRGGDPRSRRLHRAFEQISIIARGVALLSLCAIGVAKAQLPEPTFTTIGDLGGTLAVDSSDVIYGFSGYEVFSLTPPATQFAPWVQTTVYLLTGVPDGDFISALAIRKSENGGLPVLYLATSAGGSSSLGSVFSLHPPVSAGDPWTNTLIYSFTGGSDGSNPGGLTLDTGGVLYGVTEGSGTSGALPTVFSLTPPVISGDAWIEEVLQSFTVASNSLSPLTIGRQLGGLPVLFGTTSTGGSSGYGAIYKVMPPIMPGGSWTSQTLYSFNGTPDGVSPSGPLLIGKYGILYGTTSFGGSGDSGTVFSLTPALHAGDPWTEDVLYSFGGQEGTPTSGVVSVDGLLYGTNIGNGYNGGGVFSVTPPSATDAGWTLHEVHRFTGPDGFIPAYPLIERAGVLYGGTVNKGPANDGTVFTIVP